MSISDTSGQDVLLISKRPRNIYRLLAISIVVIITLAVWVMPTLNDWSNAQASVSSQRLRTALVTRGDFIRDLSIQGQVVAAVSPRLYSPAQGTITFDVDAGDTVQKGQVLAHIDSPELTNELLQEESTQLSLSMALDRQKIQAKKQALENQKAVDMAKVSLTAADREKRRADAAYSTSAISQIDFEKAQDDLENAKLVYQHAVSDAELNRESLNFEIKTQDLQLQRQTLMVEEFRRRVEELTLRSPVDGLVGNLAVEQKNQVAKNQPILSVVDLSVFEIEVAIPESYADDLTIGMDAEIALNGELHQAKLVTISPEIENNQVTGRVRFSSNSPAGLRQNQRLSTRILLEHKSDVLMVQRGQFLDSGNGRIAYVVNNGVATRQRIETGARSLASVELIAGLNVGDEIVISSTDIFQGAEQVLINN
ncbi:efflux RND transporter periplasmic adaptor subunit [Alteromonadaceae bacterium BrNp21-10]|nr:efflux RND transporter periplasmic adaptor subunit [Alteromonadaceae bacterium BrNp21-10]